MARLWYNGWQESHAQLVPPELAKYRTLESFKEKLHVRIAGSSEQLLGFSIIRDDELDQLYV